MIQVLKVPLSKDRLRALSKEERVLFLLLGYVANQQRSWLETWIGAGKESRAPPRETRPVKREW
jgi:hypothetical protein